MSNDLLVLTRQSISRAELKELLVSLGGSCDYASGNEIGQLDENREAVWVSINEDVYGRYWDDHATKLERLGWRSVSKVIGLEASSEGAPIAFKLLFAIAERFGAVFAISEMGIPDNLPADIVIVSV